MQVIPIASSTSRARTELGDSMKRHNNDGLALIDLAMKWKAQFEEKSWTA